MDGSGDYHFKLSQTKINTIDTTYMWSLKYNTNELIYETEIDSET